MEELRKYIREIMRIKKIKGVDIQKRSGGKITDSYISDILAGGTKSISVEKVNALAEGLGVDSWEVFQAASGNKVAHKEDDPWPSYALVQAIQAVVESPDLTAILKALIDAKPARVKALRRKIEADPL